MTLPRWCSCREWERDGMRCWSVVRDLGHECTTGTGGTGVPTVDELAAAIKRIEPTEAVA